MFFKDLVLGIKSYAEGLRMIAKLNLWRYFFIPALIGLFVGSAVILLAYSFSDNIGSIIAGWWPFDFWVDAVNTVSQFLGGAIVLVLGFVLFKHIVMALSAPFMAPISEKIEVYMTGAVFDHTDSLPEYIRTLLRGIHINVRNLLMELLLTIPLLILGFIPGINIVSGVLIFYVQAYYSGYGNMDYTLERHLNFEHTKTFVKRNKGIAVGNGLLFTLCLFVPIIGMMLTLPISTAASTIQTIKRLEKTNQLKVVGSSQQDNLLGENKG
jgi:CysZ protein